MSNSASSSPPMAPGQPSNLHAQHVKWLKLFFLIFFYPFVYTAWLRPHITGNVGCESAWPCLQLNLYIPQKNEQVKKIYDAIFFFAPHPVVLGVNPLMWRRFLAFHVNSRCISFFPFFIAVHIRGQTVRVKPPTHETEIGGPRLILVFRPLPSVDG